MQKQAPSRPGLLSITCAHLFHEHICSKLTFHRLACFSDVALTEAICDMCTGAACPVGCSAYQAGAELTTSAHLLQAQQYSLVYNASAPHCA